MLPLILLVLVAMAIVAGVAVLVARGGPLLPEDPAPGRPLRWPEGGEVGPDDLGDVRFGVGLRGYRMDQVDVVLGDTRRALAQRDAVIEELRARANAERDGGGDVPRRPEPEGSGRARGDLHGG